METCTLQYVAESINKLELSSSMLLIAGTFTVNTIDIDILGDTGSSNPICCSSNSFYMGNANITYQRNFLLMPFKERHHAICIVVKNSGPTRRVWVKDVYWNRVEARKCTACATMPIWNVQIGHIRWKLPLRFSLF